MRFANGLRVRGGKLAPEGVAVHAASFLRERLVILDGGLLSTPAELARIWLHELLHFVWWRLGNTSRRSYEALLLRESARGKLGWSAEWRKRALTPLDRSGRTRRWREYCAESFCDTGAWLLTGSPEHDERTLPALARQVRRRWWNRTIRYNLRGRTDI